MNTVAVGINRSGKAALLAGTAMAVSLFGATGALAQNCTAIGSPIGNVGLIANVPAGVASAVAGSLGNVSTAFLTQQTSAFVAGAPATGPDTSGAGVWARAVGGEVTVQSETAVTVNVNSPGAGVNFNSLGACHSEVKQKFVGVQAGRDLARLNLGGWNFHWGATVGYLEAKGDDIAPGSIRTEFQVPFIGSYLVATSGSFFADVMVRREFYNVTLHQPNLNLHNQTFGARGWSVSAGAGYNVGLQDGWFVEPSVGIFWSNTEVDPIGLAGPPAVPVNSTLNVDDIRSTIGRATVRVGRNFTTDGLALQPFASASVFHEFADPVTSNSTSCVGCAFINPPGAPATLTVATSTTRAGTYGQYSLGLAGQLIGTGWVGFVRGDYRKGEDLEGWTANAGLRYNFVPDQPLPVGKMATKGPALPPRPLPYLWSGFYIGAHFGVAQGRGHIEFPAIALEVQPHISGYLLGGQVGYNFQNGPFVVGVEAEVSNTNTNGTQTCGSDPGKDPASGATIRFSALQSTCRAELGDWLATAAVKLGMVSWWSDRTLFYVKAGGAWAREEVSVICTLGNNGCANPAVQPSSGFFGSDDKFGAMVGFGSEFGFTPNWSAKAEFNYIHFHERDLTANDGTVINLGGHLFTAKIGVNYRFGPPAPLAVMAKY